MFVKFLAGFVILSILGSFALLAYAIYDEYTAEKFYLRKDSWNCTASHVETTHTTMKVGEVDMPVTNTSTVCDQWSRR